MDNNAFEQRFQRWRRFGLLVGLAGLALCAVAFLFDRTAFYRGYLVGYLFWWKVSIGTLAIALLRCLVRSNWGNATWPFLRAGMATIPLIALFFLPIVWGLQEIFPWASNSGETTSHHSGFKDLYLERDFFLARAGLYFVLWLACGWIAGRTGTITGDARLPRRLSAFALMFVVVATTFAAFDWGMSLEPDWYSTIYGAMLLVGGVLAGLALISLSVCFTLKMPRSENLRMGQIFNDLGNLLLAFLMIWVYFAFSQFLIIWSGNLPAEVSWYVRRSAGGWPLVTLVLVGLHFVVPFLLLLSREQKRRPRRLATIAALLLGAHFLETFWLITPSLSERLRDVPWSTFVAPIAIGGLWVTLFVGKLRSTLRDEGLLSAE